MNKLKKINNTFLAVLFVILAGSFLAVPKTHTSIAGFILFTLSGTYSKTA